MKFKGRRKKAKDRWKKVRSGALSAWYIEPGRNESIEMEEDSIGCAWQPENGVLSLFGK